MAEVGGQRHRGQPPHSFGHEHVPEIEDYLPVVILKMNSTISVVVLKEIQKEEMRNNKLLKGKSTTSGVATAIGKTVDPDAIAITAVYNAANQLTEINLSELRNIPRILIQVIGLLIPLYPLVKKISIRRCMIDGYTLHEMSNFLPLTHLTEICLDDSPLPEANYWALLSSESKLKYLSLGRCKINDRACKLIAEYLHQDRPASKTSAVLNLTSNEITDVGALSLSIALRRNRTLRYLNLSGNRISDTGAGYIFNVLMEFPLTYEETIILKSRYFKYLRKRQSVYRNIVDLEISDDYKTQGQIQTAPQSQRKSKIEAAIKGRPSVFRKEEDASPTARVEKITNDTAGPFEDAFHKNCRVIKDGFGACLGNFALSYLNLAYNNLGYLSVKKLLAVLEYQSDVNNVGLVRVVIDGNELPMWCTEMAQVNEMFTRLICKKTSDVSRKRAKTLR